MIKLTNNSSVRVVTYFLATEFVTVRCRLKLKLMIITELALVIFVLTNKDLPQHSQLHVCTYKNKRKLFIIFGN